MTADDRHELVFDRLVDAPRAALWRCWTDPTLIVRWFTPAPWTTVKADLDVRPGGGSTIVMRSPEGHEFPNPGVFLEVIPGERLVFTDAYTAGWVPAAKPYMTAILTFADEGSGTRYVATVRHWSAEDKRSHEERGFFEGWGKATDQLEALAKSL